MVDAVAEVWDDCDRVVVVVDVVVEVLGVDVVTIDVTEAVVADESNSRILLLYTSGTHKLPDESKPG